MSPWISRDTGLSIRMKIRCQQKCSSGALLTLTPENMGK